MAAGIKDLCFRMEKVIISPEFVSDMGRLNSSLVKRKKSELEENIKIILSLI